ncbi:hypothetical protein [Marinobacterium sedimentorum]|uniref:hypothetical protein n=1 Tax=Marinobacterium sedimentorum TaxID=2927804 RepID=UPI0020C66977|nr:hypothetical protein [Marinobacterium sedimentorum]MCP8686082.1 hypothetical protein [Marinobacterium sedimentorum]
MARSLGFWLEKPRPDGDNNTKVELHFNYWSLNNGLTNYIDIGVKISEAGLFDSINFYLPFNIDQIDYKPDLGKRVCENLVLVSAIFNSPAKHESHTETKGVYDFSFTTDTESPQLRFFTQILLASDSLGGVTLERSNHENEKGCLLKFPRDLFEIETKVDTKTKFDNYFRFRVILKSDAHRSISQIYEAKDSFITNHFEKTEMVDFRVNETRNLPEKIRANLNDHSHLSRIHFFLIREANSEYKMSHSQYSRCRILEDDLWNKYLEQDDSSKKKKKQSQMLIYHWKTKEKEEDIDHFSAFAKFTRRNVTNLNILVILVVLVALSIFSGLLTNLTWSSMHKEVESCELADGTQEAPSTGGNLGSLDSTRSSREGGPRGTEDGQSKAQSANTMLDKPKHGGEQQ